MINRLLKIFFPESCPICKNPSTNHKTAPICFNCWQAISHYNGPMCQKCGKPLVSDVSITCGECIEDKPEFKWVRSFGIYDGTLKEAINLFKYYRIKRLSKPLSEMMFTLLDKEYLTGLKILYADAVIPVPLSKNKLRQREFNQSAILAKHIANHIGIKVILNCLIKTRATMPQVGLSAKERKKNIKNTFAVVDKDLVSGKRIILVDDVVTTGATVSECSRVLKKAGAEDIYVITLAHSMMD